MSEAVLVSKLLLVSPPSAILSCLTQKGSVKKRTEESVCSFPNGQILVETWIEKNPDFFRDMMLHFLGKMLDSRWRKLVIQETEGANPSVQTLLFTAETLTAIILTNNASYNSDSDTSQKDIQDSSDPDSINECREPLYYGRIATTISSCNHTGSIHSLCRSPR